MSGPPPLVPIPHGARVAIREGPSDRAEHARQLAALGLADEMRVLVDAIDAYDRDAPAVIGGDLNSFSLALADFGTPERVAEALRTDPRR